jgi:hypothetical protein
MNTDLVGDKSSMNITKSRLRQIIKEELENVLTEQIKTKKTAAPSTSMAKELGLGSHRQGEGPLKKFLQDNPEAAEYFHSRVREGWKDAPINPKALRNKSGSQFSERTVVYYKSKKEKQIAHAFGDMSLKRPWSAHYKSGGGHGWRMIGTLFNTFILSSEIKNYQGQVTKTKGGVTKSDYVKYRSQVAHTLTKEYFIPKGVYLNFLKEYGEGDKSKGAGAARLYQYTADYIEKITGLDIPGSTKNPVENMQQLSTKPIYMYSYLLIDVTRQVSRELK